MPCLSSSLLQFRARRAIKLHAVFIGIDEERDRVCAEDRIFVFMRRQQPLAELGLAGLHGALDVVALEQACHSDGWRFQFRRRYLQPHTWRNSARSPYGNWWPDRLSACPTSGLQRLAMPCTAGPPTNSVAIRFLIKFIRISKRLCLRPLASLRFRRTSTQRASVPLVNLDHSQLRIGWFMRFAHTFPLIFAVTSQVAVYGCKKDWREFERVGTGGRALLAAPPGGSCCKSRHLGLARSPDAAAAPIAGGARAGIRNTLR